MIKLNSGGSAGTGTPVAALEVVAPLEAGTAMPGRDKTYQQDDKRPDGTTPQELKTSWIEIELVDEIGRPIPYEEYEIIAPDGRTIRSGSLDQNGLAHVMVSDPGNCQITFPKLDALAWERI
ncbi:MAG: hypothetical protein IPK83_10275 [Planctomycetes bacterium]|nr:hypothetical protein [Planctomycetota bacterium]